MALLQLLQGLVAFLLLSTVLAHPGHDGTTEMKMRREYLSGLQNKALEHCTVKLKQNGLGAKIVARRQAMATHLRRKRGLQHMEDKFLVARDIDEVLKKNHHSNATYKLESPDWMIFGEKAALLSPEQTEGPYYVEGELIRKDVRDKETGIDLYIDIQMVDMNTCEPVKNVALDFWHANATGVYGGIQSWGNGNQNDTSNLQNKALRGIQLTDANGAVQFISKFPGHYMGRTNHIHVMSHVNATIQPNKTVTGGSIAHVGQIYFDQALIDQVEKTAPYITNTEAHMKNAQDFLLAQGSTNGSDPVVEYVFLGNKVEDGILAWLNFGIDPNYKRTVRAATMCSEAGCVKNPKAMGPPPGGFPKGGPGDFPFPPGFAFPSGFSFPKGPGGPGGMGPPPDFMMGSGPQGMPKQAAPSTAMPSAKAKSRY